MGRFSVLSTIFVVVLFGVCLSHASSKKPDIEKDQKECEEAEKNAQKQCSDSGNSNAQQAQQQNNQQAQTQGGSAQQNCENRKNSIPPIADLLKGFQGDCSKAQQECKQKCKKAMEASKHCASANAGPNDPPECQAEAAQAQQVGQQNDKKCEGLNNNMAAIAAALANMMLQLQTMEEKCLPQTNKDCNDPTRANDPLCKPQFNCNLAEYANDQKCICARNPRAAGCSESAVSENRTSKGLQSNSPSSVAGSDGLGRSGRSNGGSGTTPPPGQKLGNFGGSGVSAKASDKGSPNRARDGSPIKKKPTDILAADQPGGGGASRFKGGSGYPDPADPKGAARRPATRQELRRLATRDGTTGAFGRSNWLKVRERYRANRPSLSGR